MSQNFIVNGDSNEGDLSATSLCRSCETTCECFPREIYECGRIVHIKETTCKFLESAT